MNGILAGGVVILTSDGSGFPVVETVPPEIPDGYNRYSRWEQLNGSIVQMWEFKPIEGTAEEASIALAKLQAKSLPDEYAAQFSALYDEWIVGETYSGPDTKSGYSGDRVRYKGVLYKVLQDHVSQGDWTPDAAVSLYAKILPGQDGNEPEDGTYAEWERPSSTNGYSKGDRVMHNGKLWESQVDYNTWEPGGAGVYDSIWKEVVE